MPSVQVSLGTARETRTALNIDSAGAGAVWGSCFTNPEELKQDSMKRTSHRLRGSASDIPIVPA
jgi:hypothetical protein